MKVIKSEYLNWLRQIIPRTRVLRTIVMSVQEIREISFNLKLDTASLYSS